MSVIRTADERDAASIAKILNQIIRDTTITFNSVEKTPDEVATAMAEADGYLVSEDAGRITGFASFGPFRKGVGYGRVKEHSICLAQDCRQAGLGGLLLGALEDVARAQGVEHMIAGVSGDNGPGITFHARHGYVQVGLMPGIGRKFNRSIDLVLMQKTL